jgi:hypothetical protein
VTSWRCVTVALVAVSVALITWMYLRDRASYTPQQAERAHAELDAERVLRSLALPSACDGHCSIDLMERVAPHRWRVRFRGPAWQRCFVLNVSAFAYRPQSGLSGLRLIGCE